MCQRKLDKPCSLDLLHIHNFIGSLPSSKGDICFNQPFCLKKFRTRKHSSKMRTARSSDPPSLDRDPDGPLETSPPHRQEGTWDQRQIPPPPREQIYWVLLRCAIPMTESRLFRIWPNHELLAKD